MPEMFFGKSRLLILNPTLNIALTFSPFEALSQCVEDIQKADLLNEGSAEFD